MSDNNKSPENNTTSSDKKNEPRKEKKEDFDLKKVTKSAVKDAVGGGIAGSSAMVIQVCTLMWLRTTMNYQYRYGTTTTQAMKTLYAEGGIRRFYRGIGPALLQGPIARFGDTAANTGALAFFNQHPVGKDLPVFVKTLGASAMAASFRIFLMPIDACKTILQVEGKDGLRILWKKFTTTKNPAIFWHGSLASVSATFVGHYPWFATFNYLEEILPKPKPNSKLQKLGRRAVQGFVASIVSDTCSNSIRVVKTTRQTATTPITYAQAIKIILDKDGYVGLFGRGLKTRILTNGLQGLLFSVLWKTFEDLLIKKNKDKFN